MTTTIKDLTSNFVSMLESAIPTMKFGAGEAPAVTTKPYGIVYYVYRAPSLGSMGLPHDMGWVHYQFTFVATTVEQAEWASSQITHALLDMSDGNYTNALDDIISRELVSGGGITKSNDNLFLGNETYRFLLL